MVTIPGRRQKKEAKGKKARQALKARPSTGSPASSHLLAAGVVGELVVTGVQRLPGVDRVQDDFVSHDYLGSKMGTGGARMSPGARRGGEPWQAAHSFCTASRRDIWAPCSRYLRCSAASRRAG